MTRTLKGPLGATRLDEPPQATATRKLYACLEALGMEPTVWRLGGGQVAILGLRRDIKLAVEARFNVGATAKGAVSALFAGAKVQDPVGIVQNLEFDYSINRIEAKRLFMNQEMADAYGARLNALYNDGEQVLFARAPLGTAAALNEWLDDWIKMLGVDHKRQSAVRKPKLEQTAVELIEKGEWRG